MRIQTLLMLLIVSLIMTGCDACDDDVSIPTQADPNGPTFGVGMTLGDEDYDDQIEGAGDPCEIFRTGDYPARSVRVTVFVLDNNGNEVVIFEKVYRDGVDQNFDDGNPTSLKIRIPEVGGGAYKIRTTVVGYDCYDLPDPELCLECCEDGIPVWEATSPWRESTGGWVYVDYPKYAGCW